MNIWANNRFQDKASIPPPAWHLGSLEAVVPYTKEGPAHAIFLFGFNFMSQRFRAGKLIDCRYFNDVYVKLVICFLGHSPKLGKGVQSSELLGRTIEIYPEPKYSEKLKLWYINVSDFRRVAP